MTIYKIAPDADLANADLADTDLANTDLADADLAWANLTGANLTGANLTGANLTEVNLTNANLTNANLTEACLAEAIFTGANLTGTCLDPNAPVPELTDDEILDARLEIGGDLVYGWRTKTSIHCGYTMYEPGWRYEAPYFSVCQKTECHPGIYLDSEAWLSRAYPLHNRVYCYCRRDELIHAGNKWRCKQLWVVA